MLRLSDMSLCQAGLIYHGQALFLDIDMLLVQVHIHICCYWMNLSQV
ncbi:hypothetical protein yaldo0001_11870 [Yersinia aldovae ATCC 35236]|nr:hypothetical protein yaldo0001_11870 [Yersinia aldovae ATCC 35236]